MKYFSKSIYILILILFIFLAFNNTGTYANTIKYKISGKEFSNYIVIPEEKSKGVIFIIHDWNGLTDYEKERANYLAEEGYISIAIDLFGIDTKLEGFKDYRRETGALYGNREEFRKRIKKAIDIGKEAYGIEGKNYLMGYCFGGAAVLEAARAGIDMNGFISFHGGLKTPEGQNYKKTNSKILLLHGSADPVSGMNDLADLINRLEKEGVPHEAQIFGGARHAFTVSGSRDYDYDADKKSWEALKRFLSQN
jgi:dienelactone hydrolase